MSLFSSHETLYFVFAGEHDQYYFDSMLRMNTYTYLWMELRESKYETVYFIGCLNQTYTVKAIDDVSKKQYNDTCSGLFSKRAAIQPGSNIAQVEADGLRKWVEDCLVKTAGRSVALVFSLEAFARLYATASAKKQFNKLIERTHNGNSILLQTPMYLREETHALLIDPNGVFAYQTPAGASICPELLEMLLTETTVELLVRLKTRIGNRFVELGAVTYERLQSLMRCVRFQRNEDWSDEQLLEYTNCLYNWWYLSEIPGKLPAGFRRMWADLFPKLRQQGDIYASLFGKLCSDSGWKAFQDRVDRIGDLAPQFLHSLNRQKTEEKCHVELANVTLANIARIPWPEDLRPERIQPVSLHIPSREDWGFMQAMLTAPTNKPVPRDRLHSMEKYFFHLQGAEERKDWSTLCRAINALLFAGTCLYEEQEEFDYFRQYETYLDYSCDYFKMCRAVAAGQTGSDDYGMIAQRAAIMQYEEFLSKADSLLIGGMQGLKKPDAEEIAALIKTMEDPLEPSVPEEKPLFTDDIEMSDEEADALLRKRTENWR